MRRRGESGSSLKVVMNKLEGNRKHQRNQVGKDSYASVSFNPKAIISQISCRIRLPFH